MREKIKKEALEWYGNIDCTDTKAVEDFVDLIMNRTSDVLIETIKQELKNEFQTGTLKHDFIISPDYYLELKLKEVKQQFSGEAADEKATSEEI